MRRPYYETVADRIGPEAFDARVDALIAEWGNLLDREAAAMLVAEQLGGSVARFDRIVDLQEGMEANLRADVTGVSSVRTFTRQDGSEGRVVNLELRDGTAFCRMPLWDDDVALVERGRVSIGRTVRAIDCFVKRTAFGLEVTRGRFGSLIVEEDSHG